MSGSLGMLASTLPVQWLLPTLGWRPLFSGLACLLLLAIAVLAWRVPNWTVTGAGSQPAVAPAGYTAVWRHPYFRAMAPVGFFCYGGLLAEQTLWAVPWMINTARYTPLQAATGLFWINLAMLCAFWSWGMASPWLARHGLHASRLMACGLPVSFCLLATIIVASDDFPAWTGAMLALYCVSCSFVTPSQPAVGMAFAPELAGRALSAYNLVIFAGVFVIQWGIGLMIDALKGLGASQAAAFQWAFAAFLACCVASYLHFLRASIHNQTA